MSSIEEIDTPGAAALEDGASGRRQLEIPDYPPEWEPRIQSLQLKFPARSRADVVGTLLDTEGHAGKAERSLATAARAAASREEMAAASKAAASEAAASTSRPTPLPPPPPPQGPEVLEVTEEMYAEARAQKERGNVHFKAKEWDAAIECYTHAIDVMPAHVKERAVYYANRAACFAKLDEHDAVVDDCTEALDLQPEYTKALVRRALAKEALDKPDEAVVDAKKAAELDPSDKGTAAMVPRLEVAAAAKLEKQKEEMLGKMKELGNSVLGKFGLSLDNFKAEKDPNTGSYNISFGQ